MEGKKLNIFLVDDDKMFLEAIFMYLTNENNKNLNIYKFNSGEECLNQVNKIKPELVILDYYLNSTNSRAMNGMSVLKKIKELQPSTNVVMLSAQDNIDIAVETLTQGAFDYISKTESAFVKVKNIIVNVSQNMDVTSKLKSQVAIYKTTNFILILILVLLFILSRIL